MYDLIIIGGGAAGLMAAVTAADLGARILLIEKNAAVGKKLLITGKGRCNVTNACGRDEFFENIPTNPRFLYSAYGGFSNEDTMNFFEGMGVPLKIERGGRVFPVSDRAADITAAFERAIAERKDMIKLTRGNATEIIINENKTVCGVMAQDKKYLGEKVILAAGGASYPGTGSDGSGYRLAEAAGHTIISLRPSLVPLICAEGWCKEVMGLSLKNVTLSLFKGEKKIYSEMGEMLFTHFGISGPLVLSASGHMREPEKGKYSVSIDLKPALDEKTLDERVRRDFGEFANRDFANSLDKLLPRKIIPIIIGLSGIDSEKKVNSITKEERQRLVGLLKNLRLGIKNFRPAAEAIVTGGGVNVKEINPKTMESKIIKGLYFAGEVIDVDGFTGGFNLQIAFSTGAAAARAACLY